MAIDSEQIQKLYITYFGRPADPSGVTYWSNNSSKSTQLREISNAIFTQLEFKKSVISKTVISLLVT